MIRKAHDALAEATKSGKFERTASGFRRIIGTKDETLFLPEFDRYHLYISLACPWANRCLAVINMKGLQECIKVTVVHPTWQRTRPDVEDDTHCGWAFSEDALHSPSGQGLFKTSKNSLDIINGAKYVRDLYEMSDDHNYKYSVPVLWDKKTRQIVNNESSEIVRMFNTEFNAWATGPLAHLDLYPPELREHIDAANDWIYPHINDGVYKCGFARTQQAYDEAVTNLFNALDRLEALLASSRYVAGAQFTEADLRLFMTLVRFDEVYVVYFKCNVRRLVDYPNIRQYMRDVYQLPGMAESIDMDHIKTHYFT
jgi:putative glutathione S-transferase